MRYQVYIEWPDTFFAHGMRLVGFLFVFFRYS
jgi:hypothetical protein